MLSPFEALRLDEQTYRALIHTDVTTDTLLAALLSLAIAEVMLSAMNKLSAGAVFLICLLAGIIFDQVAIGILAGLVLGAGAGKVTANPPGDRPE